MVSAIRAGHTGDYRGVWSGILLPRNERGLLANPGLRPAYLFFAAAFLALRSFFSFTVSLGLFLLSVRLLWSLLAMRCGLSRRAAGAERTVPDPVRETLRLEFIRTLARRKRSAGKKAVSDNVSY